MIADHSPGSATHSGGISSEVFSETWKNLAELLLVNTLSQKNISKNK
jgi:hypothetical protein